MGGTGESIFEMGVDFLMGLMGGTGESIFEMGGTGESIASDMGVPGRFRGGSGETPSYPGSVFINL